MDPHIIYILNAFYDSKFHLKCTISVYVLNKKMFFVWFLFFVYIITINCQNNVLTLTDKQRQAMLDKHNQYRKDCANGVYSFVVL